MTIPEWKKKPTKNQEKEVRLWRLQAMFTFSEGDSGDGLEKTLSISYPTATYIIAALLAAAVFQIVEQDDTSLSSPPGVLSSVPMSGEVSYRRIRDQSIKSRSGG